MTCEACEAAEKHPRTAGLYIGGCLNCQARAVAHSPEAHDRERCPEAIQVLMRRIWTDKATYQKGRTLTWEWIQRFEKGE